MSAKNEIPLEVKEEARALAGLKPGWEFDRKRKNIITGKKSEFTTLTCLVINSLARKLQRTTRKKGRA